MIINIIKKITLLILVFILSTKLFAQIEPLDTDGNGYRNITSLDHLLWITENTSSWSNNYELDNNINATETINWNDGEGWLPIGRTVGINQINFTGKFNGKNNSIQNLYINRPYSLYVGFFGTVNNSEIINLNLIDVSISGGQYTGSLIGNSGNSKIDNISATGQVVSASTSTGGLIGKISDGIMHNLKSNVNVSGTWATGGLIGYMTNSTNQAFLFHSYSEGTVQGVNHVGGLCGYSSSEDVLISDCFSKSNIIGESNVGGFIGYISNSMVNCSFSTGSVFATGTGFGGFIGSGNSYTYFCYWDTLSSGLSVSAAGIGKSTEEMKQIETFSYYDFNYLWSVDEGLSYPYFKDLSVYSLPTNIELSELNGTGTENNPYIITNASELNSIRKDLTAHYRLGNNIDLSSSLVWNFGLGWEPIGKNSPTSARFTGSLDGSGYSITGLHTNFSNINYAGLFGYIQNAVISNLKLKNCRLINRFYLGLLAGYSNNSIINNTEVDGEVISCSSPDISCMVGGLFGYVFDGNVANSSANINIYGSKEVGGLIGIIDNGAEVTASCSFGNINATTIVGGFIGKTLSSSSIINDSYSRASVNGISTIGGFVGYRTQSSINRSFSTGAVTGTGNYIGGFIGNTNYGSSNYCYWDTQTSGMTTSAGGTGVMGKTTNQMTFPYGISTFTTWDFNSIWSADEDYSMNNGYPFFSWQIPSFNINLSSGWNTISSNILPSTPNMENIFAEIEELVIVKNADGQIFNSAQNINQIGDWNIAHGYMVYVTAPATLQITGTAVNPTETEINLVSGWNLVSYLRNSPLAINSALAGISNSIILVKNNLGQLYYPAFGLNTLGNMLPGQGYWIYMNSSAVLVYPGN